MLEEIQGLRPQAFKAKSGELGVSIELDCLMKKAGVTTQSRFGLMPNTLAMIAVTAGVARANSAGVAWTPKPEESANQGFAASANDFHGEVILPMTNRQLRELFSKHTVVHSLLP